VDPATPRPPRPAIGKALTGRSHSPRVPVHRLLPIALLALLAAPALAGCITEIPDAATGAAVRPASLAGVGNLTAPDANATAPAADLAPVSAPPRWALGDWWRYEAVSDTTVVATFTLIVADVSPSQYRLVTDNPEIAMWDEIWDMALVGPISASDLSARQRGNEVKFLQWPLANGTTWWTRVDDVQAQAFLAGPDAKGRWTTTLLSNNRTYATFEYDPAVRMFTDVDFVRDDLELRLVASGTDYAGNVGSVVVSMLAREERAGYGPLERFFTVDAGTSRVRVTVDGATERFFSHHLVFVGPDNGQRQPIAARTCTAKCEEFKEAQLDPLVGRWKILGDFGAIGGKLTLEVAAYRFVEHPFVARSPL